MRVRTLPCSKFFMTYLEYHKKASIISNCVICIIAFECLFENLIQILECPIKNFDPRISSVENHRYLLNIAQVKSGLLFDRRQPVARKKQALLRIATVLSFIYENLCYMTSRVRLSMKRVYSRERDYSIRSFVPECVAIERLKSSLSYLRLSSRVCMRRYFAKQIARFSTYIQIEFS